MRKEKSAEERVAEVRLLEEAAKALKNGRNAATLTDALTDLVRTRGSREGIDEERQKSLEGIINAFGETIDGPPKALYPDPNPKSDNIIEQLGLKSSKQLREEIKGLQEQTQKMRRAMEGMIPLVSNIKRQTLLPEASPVLEKLNDALSNMTQESLKPGGICTSRFHQQHIQLGNVHRDLQFVETIEALNRLRNDRLYPNLLQVRQIILEGHAMVARPAMGRISVRPNANLVLLLGGESTQAVVKPVLEKLCLNKLTPRFGAEEALNRWQDMLRAYLVICDFTQRDPALRSSIAYQLGWARTLGRPIVVLVEQGQLLPFDIDIQPTRIDDVATIESAIVDVMFVPPSSGLDRSASRRTVSELKRLYRDYSGNSFQQALKLLMDEGGEVDDGALFDRIRSFLSFAPDDRPDLLTPEWPPSYPSECETRMFHVMPFHSGWPDTARDAAEKGAGSAYRRHDNVVSDHIIRSLWDEIAAASHVLVDVTELNDNVLIELGMAHALGKSTRIVAQDNFNMGQIHPILRYWRVWLYDLERPSTLTKIVKDFLTGKN